MSQATVQITAAQARAAYDALGLPADQWVDTIRVEITPHLVQHTAFARGSDGKLQVGQAGGVLSEEVQYVIDRFPPQAKEPTTVTAEVAQHLGWTETPA